MSWDITRLHNTCTFLAEILYAFNKRTLSSYKFGEIESLKLGTLMGSLRQNNIQKVQSYLLWTKIKEKMSCSFKFSPNHSKVPKFTSMDYFCPKYPRFELKEYGGVIFHDTEQWCKVWINPDLVVPKMTWGIGWTFITALKNCTFMGSFCPKDMFQLENFRLFWIMCHDTEG